MYVDLYIYIYICVYYITDHDQFVRAHALSRNTRVTFPAEPKDASRKICTASIASWFARPLRVLKMCLGTGASQDPVHLPLEL